MLIPQLWLDGSVHLSFHLNVYVELTHCIFMKHRIMLAIHQGLCMKESDFFPKKNSFGQSDKHRSKMTQKLDFSTILQSFVLIFVENVFK